MENLDAVRETEEHLMNAWPSLRTVVCNGWVFRQADGYTKRANSANAMAARGPFAPTLESARKFYSSFDCPTIFRLTPLAGPEPDRILASLGFYEVDETLVMTAAISNGTAAESGIVIDTACTEEWETGYAAAHAQDPTQRRQHRAILNSIAP
ncbi:MAG: GNAT family N-acetyltransferase, partial [Rhizomicrobium sp.]